MEIKEVLLIQDQRVRADDRTGGDHHCVYCVWRQHRQIMGYCTGWFDSAVG